MRDFWQDFCAPLEPPWHEALTVLVPGGRHMALPIRDLGGFGIGGLILNQASFGVLHAVVAWVARAVRDVAADVVVGLPTLGHALAAPLAQALGHANWVPAGFSRKRWYQDALSVPVTSITTPGAGRLLYLDPRLLHRLAARRVLLVDDVISTGASAQAGLALLAAAGVRPVAMAVAMAQGNRWRADWPHDIPLLAGFASPIVRPTAEGWVAEPETTPHETCTPMTEFSR